MSGLDAAVERETTEEVAAAVRDLLSSLICSGSVQLPEALRSPQPDGYARNLLYRSAESGYEVIAMVWGPGQGTPLHDHAGIWCVDGVLQGRVLVTQFDLLKQQGDRFQFQPQETVEAGVGMAGCLIPPFEYHTIANGCSGETSVTLHVYGGRMDACTIFEPEQDGWYHRSRKDLAYS